MSSKRYRFALLLIPAACLALVLTSAEAKQKPDPDDPVEDSAATAVEQVATAYRLVEFGRANKAPEALITAAGLLRQVPPLKPSDAKVETESEDPRPADPTEPVKSLKAQADDLFTEALVMAPKEHRDGVEKLINAAKNRPNKKGSASGPKVINRVLGPKATHNWKIQFTGGQPATVGFRAARVCRISWHGPAGGMIGKDDCMVGRAGWMPGRTATHTIRIHNLSPLAVAYSIFTN